MAYKMMLRKDVEKLHRKYSFDRFDIANAQNPKIDFILKMEIW